MKFFTCTIAGAVALSAGLIGASAASAMSFLASFTASA